MASLDEKAALAAAEAAKARNFERSMKSMKKAVLEVQLILLDGVDTDEQLHAAGKILAQSEYGDAVEERAIAKVCGYPRCANALSENTRKGRYRVSLSQKKVYDLEESRHFCSPECLITSKDFGNKLPSRQDLVESAKRFSEILALVRGSQYAARSKPVRLKEDDVLKPLIRPKKVNCGKVRPKGTRNARSASSDILQSPVEERGQLETSLLSSNLSTLPAYTILKNENIVDDSGLNTKGSLIVRQVEQSNIAGSNPSPNFQTILATPSKLGSNGKAAGTITKSALNAQKLRPEKDFLASTSISSPVQTKSEKLKIQERVGEQAILPMFDYGGPSDAIEGYVPLRSRNKAVSSTVRRTQFKISENTNSNDATLRSGEQDEQRPRTSGERNVTGEKASTLSRDDLQRSERACNSQGDGAGICKEWEGLVSGSPQAGPAKMCITEVDGETSFIDSTAEYSTEDFAASTSSSSKYKDVHAKSAYLKPALKKQSRPKKNVLGVLWAVQSKAATIIERIESKERASIRNADEALISEKGTEDVIRLEEKVKSMKLKEEERPQTRLSESSLDLAMAARLASAEAIATALTEAATSAATGEFDGSEAVAQAGISILSATHNANSASSASPLDAQYQSGEILESMKSSAVDEDELFARAAQAREEMRRLKMPRKHAEIRDNEGFENDDLIDDFDPEADANMTGNFEDEDGADDDGDDDEDDDDDDDFYDDESGGFEGASEVGFTAPPKGFKAEISMFGTIYMALEIWISAAAVAHIYGKDLQAEDEYLSVNGREYSRQTVIGDGVSAEILRTFSLCLSRALPEVVRALHLSVPMSTLEVSLGRLIKTMSFVEALPPFGTKHWRMLVILMLDALSIQRLPRLGVYFLNNRSVLRKVLDSTGTSEAEYDVFREVLLPLGRSPTFSTLSGG